MRGAVRPAGRPRGGPPVGGRRRPGLGPCAPRFPARPLRLQTDSRFWARSLSSRGSGCIGFCPSAPFRGSFPQHIPNTRSSSPPPPLSVGVQTPSSEAGILELSPSKRRRTGPRGQIGLSPPLLPSRGGFPGPPLRKGEGEEEVARGGERAPRPLSPLGTAAGRPHKEEAALGHHSDPYQASPHSQGPQGPPCQLGAGLGA